MIDKNGKIVSQSPIAGTHRVLKISNHKTTFNIIKDTNITEYAK